MRSKNWSCKLSWPLIRKDITRFWPVWGSYLAVWLLILPIPLLNFSVADYSSTVRFQQAIHRLLVSAGSETALVMTALYGGVSAFAVWSYLYQGRSASLFHALPVTRETLFCSHFTAGLGFLLVPNVLIALLSYLCQMSLGLFDPALILTWLAVVSLQCLLFYAIGTLAAQLTGSLPAMPALYGLLNFAVVVCESMLNEYGTMLYFGVTSLDLKLSFLSPFAHLLDHSATLYQGQQVTADGIYFTWENYAYYDPEYVILLCLYGLAALVLILCALLLYRRRSTESAGDVIAVPQLRPVAKYGFAFGCALVLGWVLDQILFPVDSTPATVLLSLAMGGAVGYIAAAMLLKKSFRVFQPRQMAGLLALWVVLACIVGVYAFDLLGVERLVPEADEIDSVTLSCEYDISLSQAEPALLAQVRTLHRSIIQDKDRLEAYPGTGDQVYVRFEYLLKDGTEVVRRYHLPYSGAQAADAATPLGKLAILMDDPQRIADNLLPPEDAIIESLTLYMEDLLPYASDLWTGHRSYHHLDTDHIPLLREALREDILTGRLARWHRNTAGAGQLCNFEFSYSLPQNDPVAVDEEIAIQIADSTKASSRWRNIQLFSNENATSTLTALQELGYLTEIPEVTYAE